MINICKNDIVLIPIPIKFMKKFDIVLLENNNTKEF